IKPDAKRAKPITTKSYNLSYFEAGRSSRIRSLLSVNEEFENKPDAKRAKPITTKSYNLSYFEAGRRWRNRSILNVCEDFNIKPDAKRAKLDGFTTTRF
ncbi:MAG: hypothetical protein IKA38_06155, partial [Alistipes sp.]|nr:hypothetical protein [Alistipes sp.]